MMQVLLHGIRRLVRQSLVQLKTLFEKEKNITANWGLQIAVPFPGFPDYWCALGTRLHLQVPGITEGRGNVF